MMSVTDNTSIERLKIECAGVAAGSKILVGEAAEAAEACRAFTRKPTRAAKLLIRAEARFSEPAILANRFVTSKATCVRHHRSRLFNEYRL
jgi:hypothetical protein